MFKFVKVYPEEYRIALEKQKLNEKQSDSKQKVEKTEKEHALI